MSIQLIVASGSRSGQKIPITGENFIIGRADDCHLKPRSELISRYHCAIVVDLGVAAVRDLGSKNGVYVNGERTVTEHVLKNGDRLMIGPLEFFVNVAADDNESTVKPAGADDSGWLKEPHNDADVDVGTDTAFVPDLLKQLQALNEANKG